MTVQGCDYSFARPGPDELAVYAFVCRYLATLGDGGKGITPSEFQAHLAAGRAVVLNLETMPDRALSGAPAGLVDAHLAIGALDTLGVPDAVVYFSVDTDARWELAAVLAYFQAIATVIPPARIGIYGGSPEWKTVRTAGLASYWWQPNASAWSDGWPDPDAHIVQHSTITLTDGSQVDPDTAQAADYGQWPRPEVDVPLTPDDIAAILTAITPIIRQQAQEACQAFAATQEGHDRTMYACNDALHLNVGQDAITQAVKAAGVGATPLASGVHFTAVVQ